MSRSQAGHICGLAVGREGGGGQVHSPPPPPASKAMWWGQGGEDGGGGLEPKNLCTKNGPNQYFLL